MNNSLYDAYVHLQVVCDRAKHNADELDRLRAENARLREALDMVMTGGNHIAIHLPEGCPPFEADHLTALETLGAGCGYDIWCCWKAIMTARAALQDKGDE